MAARFVFVVLIFVSRTEPVAARLRIVAKFALEYPLRELIFVSRVEPVAARLRIVAKLLLE